LNGARQITDEGVAKLVGFRLLSYLDLAGTQVSDNGLTALEVLRNLSDLHLEGTQVSDEGVRRLQEKHKARGQVCIIEH
jgi:hypothetical protein